MTLVSSITQLFTGASVLAGVDLTLVNLSVTQPAGKSWIAAAGEVIDAVLAHSVLAEIVDTVIVVGLTSAAGEARRTVADEGAEAVPAEASIVARGRGAVVNVALAVGPREPIIAGAPIAIDQIYTNTVALAGVAATFVDIDLTSFSSVTWHTNARKLSSSINASSQVLAGLTIAFIDILFTPWSGVTLWTLASVGAVGVDADSLMLTRGGALGALVNILITIVSLEARGTGAGSLASNLVGVAPSSGFARIDVALVVQVTEEASLARGTLALVFANLVNAGASVVARLGGAVILVHLTVSAGVSVDTDALVAALRVPAGAVVLTRIGQCTLVHIVKTVVSCPVVSALTRVRVDPVNTRASVVANTVDTIVNVHFAVGSSEATWT